MKEQVDQENIADYQQPMLGRFHGFLPGGLGCLGTEHGKLWTVGYVHGQMHANWIS